MKDTTRLNALSTLETFNHHINWMENQISDWHYEVQKGNNRYSSLIKDADHMINYMYCRIHDLTISYNLYGE